MAKSKINKYKQQAKEKAVSHSTESDVDFEGLHEYMVEKCELETEETLVGVISGYYDLGLQPQQDARIEFKGTEDQEDEIIEKYPETYFEDGKDGKRYKCFPQKPQKCISLAIDFPEIPDIDKALFFGGESNPAPLRLIMGGKFFTKENGMILGRTFPIGLRKNDKTNNQWSLAHNSTIYKIAVATGVVEQGEPLLPEDLPDLLGKSAQFSARVWFNENKGKKYYNESVKFVGKLGRKQEPEEIDEDLIHMVRFDFDNDLEDIKQLRSEVKNTMALALDWDESDIKEKLSQIKDSKTESNTDVEDADYEEEEEEEVKPKRRRTSKDKKEESEDKPVKRKTKTSSKKPAKKVEPEPEPEDDDLDEDDLDDDLPF